MSWRYAWESSKTHYLQLIRVRFLPILTLIGW